MGDCVSITENPPENGRYLVKFYSKYMPEYDCTELVFREYKDGKWVNPVYNYQGDGYELVGWYRNE